MVVPLTINGAGIRDIERVLFLSTNTILKTLMEAATLADDPAYPRRVHDLEMDEFWSFVSAKRRQRWTWYGYDRQRRKVVAFVLLLEIGSDARCSNQTLRASLNRWPSSFLIQDLKSLP